MKIHDLFRTLRASVPSLPHSIRRRRRRSRLIQSAPQQVERLEDRALLANWNPLAATADGAADSLRDAIMESNADALADADEIVLGVGTYTLTISNNGQDNQGNFGDLDIDRDSSTQGTLTIRGQGEGQTIIDQTVQDRVFHILDSGVTVIFEDLTIQNGTAVDDGTQGADPQETDSHGGGILVEGGDVTLTNVTLSDNKADGEDGTTGVSPSHPEGFDGVGGGVYATSGSTINITDSNLTGNEASGGDGLSGTSNNDGGDGHGGGVYVETGVSLTISGTTFDGNKASGGAGGTASWGSPGDGGDGIGGGLYADSGAIVDINSSSVFQNNEANGGAGGNVTSGTYTTPGTGGAGRGGGMYATQAGSLTIDSSSFLSNQANGGLGGDNNSSAPGSDGGPAAGGGLYLGGGTVDLTDVTINQNIVRGADGGDGDEASSSNSGFDGGDGGTAFGGGVWVEAANVTVTGGSISINSAIGGAGGSGGNGASSWNSGLGGGSGGSGGNAGGGGMYQSGGTLEVSGGAELFHNNAIGGAGGDGGDGGSGRSYGSGGDGGAGGAGGDARGGGMYLDAVPTVTLNDITIDEGGAFGGGGGAGGNGGDGGDDHGGSQVGDGGNGGEGGAGGDAQGGGLYATNPPTMVINGELVRILNGLVQGGIGGPGGAGGDGGTGTTYEPGGGFTTISTRYSYSTKFTIQSECVGDLNGMYTDPSCQNPTTPGFQGFTKYTIGTLTTFNHFSSTLEPPTPSATNVVTIPITTPTGGGGTTTITGSGGDGGDGGDGGRGQGGGAYISGTTLNLVDSTIDGNEAREAGYDSENPLPSFGSGGSGGSGSPSGDSGSNGQVGEANGGGLYNTGFGTIDLRGTTVSNNIAEDEGGGVWNQGFFDATNSTFSVNNAGTIGGGIYSGDSGGVDLLNVTITNNSTENGHGPGIYNSFTILTMHNTIAVGNFDGAADNGNGAYCDIWGEVNSSSTNNLVGVGDGLTGISNGPNNNQVGSSGSPILQGDVLNSLLDDNGGPTLTHLIVDSGPAHNAGNNSAPGVGSLTADQRGFEDRIEEGTIDIGAVELNAVDPADEEPVTVRYDFDGGFNVTQTDYTGVLRTRIYGSGTSGSDYGWISSPGEMDGGASINPLLRDGALGQFSGNARTFKADVPQGSYYVNVTNGYWNQKLSDIRVVVDGGTGTADVTYAGIGTSGANKYSHTLLGPVDVDAGGMLTVTVSSTTSPATPTWVLNGLEIIPTDLTDNIDINAADVIGDAGTPVTISGTSDLAAGTLVTLSTNLGNIQTDASTQYDGKQVAVDASGDFSFNIINGFGGTATISAVAVDGSAVNLTAGEVEFDGAPGPRIIDDGDADYVQSGMGELGTNNGFAGDLDYTGTGGAGTSTWTFDGLVAGQQYRLSTTWFANSTQRATNAPYLIDGIDDTGLSGTPNNKVLVFVNQRNAPNDFSDSGANWEDLRFSGNGGIFTAVGSTITVSLSAGTNGNVIADAVRIEPAKVQVIDDGGLGYTQTNMNQLTTSNGFGGDFDHTGANGAGVSTWTFVTTPGNLYSVSATWYAKSNRATNARYLIEGIDDEFLSGINNDKVLVAVNQRMAPNDLSDSGANWEYLRFSGNGGIFEAVGSTITVSLSAGTNGNVIADAIRLEDVSPLHAETPATAVAASVPESGTLSLAAASPLVDQAIAAWSAVDATAAARLADVQVQIVDLPRNILGVASESTDTIWLDASGDGYGWNVTSGGSMDLLTVITHELGHVLGHADLDPTTAGGNIMSGSLSAGLRRLPGLGETTLAPLASVATAPARAVTDFGTASLTSDFVFVPFERDDASSFSAANDNPWASALRTELHVAPQRRLDIDEYDPLAERARDQALAEFDDALAEFEIDVVEHPLDEFESTDD